MLNWSAISQDPNSPRIFTAWKEFYDSISELVFLPELKLNHQDFIVSLINKYGDRILDIGIAEHTHEYIERNSWFHRKLRQLGQDKEIWGIDINGELISHIQSKFDWSHLYVHDATTHPLKNEYFDVIHAGDVIEHVSNLGGFLSFCRDSLKPGGRIVLTTPNPHAMEFIKRAREYGTIPVNAEHTCWMSAPTMNELCRRYGLEFEKSYFLCGKKKTRQIRLFGKKLFFKYRDLIWYDSLWVIRKPEHSR